MTAQGYVALLLIFALATALTAMIGR